MLAAFRRFSSKTFNFILNIMRNFRKANKKTKAIAGVAVLFVLLMVISYFSFVTHLENQISISELIIPNYEDNFAYVVEGDACEIPKINPYTPKLVGNLSLHMSCAIQPHLTRPLVTKHLENDTDLYVLHINENWKSYYVQEDETITCCYRDIRRAVGDTSAEFKPSTSSCRVFQQDFHVPVEVNGMIVNCMKHGSKIIIFMDAFFFIQKREYAEKGGNKIGVLIFGIDSLSQINLRRRMPVTYNYLRNNKDRWYEMLGYNKLGYDALPNLMALLTGYNLAMKHKDCNPQQEGALDTCPFLWKQAKVLGMPTAFAEDRADIHTLTTDKARFIKPPTDYYLRPYMLAAQQQLGSSANFKVSKYCLGARLAANHVLGYALEFALQFRGHGGLGVFWLNSFRDSYEDVTMIQNDLYNYLDLLRMYNILDNYVVLLLSGNGMLHGRLNNIKSGFYEERLPILYISIPQPWKSTHPEYEQSLHFNRRRLVSPLDLHETVKHALALDAQGYSKFKAVPSTDCPECRSILKPMHLGRTCHDASIDWMSCSCRPYYSQNTYSNVTTLMMHKLLAEMNKYLQRAGMLNGTCQTLSLHTIYGVYQSQRNHDYYYVKFKTSNRNAEFELAIVYRNEKSHLYIDKTKIRRLDDEAVGCLMQGDSMLKKLCVCTRDALKKFV